MLMLLSTAAWSAPQVGRDLGIVTSEERVQSSLEQKRAYLFGIGNMLEIEPMICHTPVDQGRAGRIFDIRIETAGTAYGPVPG